MPKPETVFTLNYTLNRPFPFRWFTHSVLLGGIVLTVLFSFVAVASNAYEFQPVYSTDPNRTESERKWFQKAPFSWIRNMDTRCDDAQLTTGGTYLTMNRGYAYTLDQIHRWHSETNASEITSVAAYHNNTLRDCHVTEIEIDFARSDDTRRPTTFWTWQPTSASATVDCAIGHANENMTAEFSLTLPNARTWVGLPDYRPDYESIWYGAQLTALWYRQLSAVMAYSVPRGIIELCNGTVDEVPDTTCSTDRWTSGYVKLWRNINIHDYTDLTFFNAEVNFYSSQGILAWLKPNATIWSWRNNSSPASQLPGGGNGLPNITATVDAFAKSFYSTLLADFGSNDNTSAVLSTAGIDYLQSITDNVAWSAARGINCKDPVCMAGTINTVLNMTSTDTHALNESLGTVATTIFAQYLCSVPHQKSGFSLFFSVLLADIVFLSACWSILSWVSSWWVARTDSYANFCAGCVPVGDGIALAESSSSHRANEPLTPISRTSANDDDTDRLSTITTQPLIAYSPVGMQD